ncbi:hypothetical protein L3Q67_15105 [Saccharothrix sp. AJ9571]|nr:hypothetical protein L3Q67_15105 [Saccharothrix sp. AJ9571]
MVAIEVSESSVRELAGPKSFERGEKYFAAGQVRRVSVDGKTVSAAVEGTHVYRVQLEITRCGLRGTCSCPYGAESFFCKHCVATALAWLDQGGKPGKPRRKPLSDNDLRSFLGTCDQSWLVDQLMTATNSDPVLRARLAVAAGADANNAFDDRELRKRLEMAIEVADYVDEVAAYSYFHHVDEALNAVEHLLTGGFPHAAATLAEYALELLDAATDQVEDLDGLHAMIERAEEIHQAGTS